MAEPRRINVGPGRVLLLDRSGALRLTFGTMAPMAFAVVGVILLVTGLSRRE